MKQSISIHNDVVEHSTQVCPVCFSTDVSTFVNIFNIPIHCHLIWKTRDQALQIPKGDIQLGFCKACEHVFNCVFNPQYMQYDQKYENSLHFSPHFQGYAQSLATDLTEHYALYDKKIIEIGCGKGDFLALLCEMGGNQGIGFDPSAQTESNDHTIHKNMTVINDFYSEKYFDYHADFVVCRHVLEHMHHPRDFLMTIRASTSNSVETFFYFEVPDVAFTLRDLGIWDLIYEHCSYFSVKSLVHLFRSCGFEIHKYAATFGGQFLRIETSLTRNVTQEDGSVWNHFDSLATHVENFADAFQNRVNKWRRRLTKLAQQGKRAVIWGAGSKGVTFLNVLGIQSEIDYVVDINPDKHGNYIAGTGQKIVPPSFLTKEPPALLIVMNPVYLDEIKGMMRELNVATEITPA